jgi:3-hydroxyacyl-[acyl-carrier-protein] dehydratase
MEKSVSIEQSIMEKCLTSISVSDTGSIIGAFSFATDFPAFDGHFPEQPVLPAVVQLAAVRLLAARHLGAVLVPAGMERAKFKSMVGPEEPLRITIQIDRTDNNVSMSFAITTEKRKVATGEISCLVVNGER